MGVGALIRVDDRDHPIHYWGWAEGSGKKLHVTPLRGGRHDDMEYPVNSYCSRDLAYPMPVPYLVVNYDGAEHEEAFPEYLRSSRVCRKCQTQYDLELANERLLTEDNERFTRAWLGEQAKRD